jgi:hypothetical protein
MFLYASATSLWSSWIPATQAGLDESTRQPGLDKP